MKANFWSTTLRIPEIARWAEEIMKEAFKGEVPEAWLSAIREGTQRWGSGYFWNAPSDFLFLFFWDRYGHAGAAVMGEEGAERSRVLRGRAGFELTYPFYMLNNSRRVASYLWFANELAKECVERGIPIPPFKAIPGKKWYVVSLDRIILTAVPFDLGAWYVGTPLGWYVVEKRVPLGFTEGWWKEVLAMVGIRGEDIGAEVLFASLAGLLSPLREGEEILVEG